MGNTVYGLTATRIDPVYVYRTHKLLLYTVFMAYVYQLVFVAHIEIMQDSSFM